MKDLAPIILFVYARPEHTENTINALSKNELAKESDIFIFSDNAKNEKSIRNVEKVREFIHTIPEKNWFKSVKIIEAEKNRGLANSVIDGVSKVINNSKKVIVLEDDLIPSKTFLKYMNEALEFYKDDERIWSISGYNVPIEIPKEYKYDIYLGYRGCSWGWATWVDRWNAVDWKVRDYKDFKFNYKKRKKLNRGGPDMAQMLDLQMQKQIDSWAIRWCYEQSKQNKFTIYPTKSLIENQGLDGSGTHSGTTNIFDVQISEKLPKLEKNIEIDKKITKNFYEKYDGGIKLKIMGILTMLRMGKVVNKIKGVRKNK